jgi:DNA-binding NarL/FixJ family response regulator
MTTKLLIGDHREVIRAGLRQLLGPAKIEVVAEATTGAEVVPLSQKHRPDVVLLGRLVDEDGLSALTRMTEKCPDTPVITMGITDNPTHVARSLALGASGCLSENCPCDEFITAIRTAATGKDAWTEKQLKRFTGTPMVPAEVDVTLTRRELQVLRQLAFGLPNREIALLLGISVETVKEHVQHVIRKLGVSDRTKAAVWAVRHGLD